jgi:hypothetical protein
MTKGTPDSADADVQNVSVAIEKLDSRIKSGNDELLVL